MLEFTILFEGLLVIFNRHAKVVMEEGYMRLSIEYTLTQNPD